MVRENKLMQTNTFHRDPIQQLSAAWLLRWNQKIDESLIALSEVCARSGWKEISISHFSSIENPHEKDAYIEALLLKSSLLRAQGEKRKSSQLVKKIVDLSDESLLPRKFRIQFELGIDHWVNEDLSSAIEYFLMATRESRNSIEKIYSLSNLLWCLESLDLPREKVELQLVKLIEENRQNEDIGHLIEQWTAYNLRKNFYNDLSISVLDVPLTGQSEFFYHWTRLLPYKNLERVTKSGFEILNSGKYLWQGSYRYRTLNGIWYPADLHITRISDAIDRIYLWTWWWMADGEYINSEKIIWTLESILENFEFESQSKENLLLFRNTLSWITFIEPTLKSRFEKISNKLNRLSSGNYPVLETEFALIQLLLVKTNDQKGIKQLKLIPAFYRIYKKLMEEKTFLPRLQKRLTPILNINPAKDYRMVVDVAHNEIRIFNSYQVLKSKNLTKLIALIEKDGKVRFDQLMKGKDADDRKIYNLVIRIRQLTTNLAVRIKNHEIVKGIEWPSVLVINDEENSLEDLDKDKIEIVRPTSVVNSLSYIQAARVLTPDSFTRKDLEKNLKVSKATACRMIEKWQREELIEFRGKAKSIRYFWISRGVE
jgi:hypothetical protein